jgi:serine/threonine-protein kinase
LAEELIAGRYTVQEELGRGASATVYRARDTLLDRPVALKIISSGLASDPEFTWRFEQEARLAARLDHPNIVTVYDVGAQADGRAFIAMRLLQGKALDQLMRERGVLSADEVLRVVDQLAAALDYTHAAGLVHRDVKPSNVTVDDQLRVTLTDFGIARALDSARVTLPGLTIGTPRYMSPEQVRGADTTPATDEYSLAVMAYEMMAGRPPFEGDGTALMYQIVHEEPPAPTEFNPALSTAVAEVIQAGLAKEPTERWASCGEFARRLSEALRGASAVAAAPPGPDASGQVTRVSLAPTVVQPSAPEPLPAAEERPRPTTIIPPAAAPSAGTEATRIEPAAAPAPPPAEPTLVAPATAKDISPGTVVAPASLDEVPAAPAPAPKPKVAKPGTAEPLTKGAALTWAAAAALLVGGAAVALFVALGGGDGEGRFEPDDLGVAGQTALSH